MNDRARIDVAALRARLAGQQGRRLWRSLDELADTPAFQALLHDEFPQHAAALAGGVDRRVFLKMMAASLGLAGLSACTRQPEERILPYVRQPEALVLGEPRYFATAIPTGGFATGVVVESHTYRPTKIEGNPSHPASLGAADPTVQAALLGLYDPDRSQTITSAGEIRTWRGFVTAMRGALEAQRQRRGAGLRLLTETVTSPTLSAQITALLAEFPAARWHQWEPVGRDGARLGATQAFGEPIETRYDLGRADVVVALDADLFGVGPARLRHAHDVTRRRRPDAPGGMNRLYVVESMPSTMGALADHRLALRSSEVDALARALAIELGLTLGPGPAVPAVDAQREWVSALARDLRRRPGASAVIAGEHQPPAVHAIAHALNATLGNVGTTVFYSDPVEAQTLDQSASLRALVAEMDTGAVELLLVLGGNPVFTAPVDLRFAERLAKVPLRIHLGPYDDETAERCHWHVNEAHPLESWGDLCAYDGTVTIQQPLIAPLYGGRTAGEVLAALGGREEASGYDLVRERWKAAHGADGFDAFWQAALQDGVVTGTTRPPRRVTLRPGWDRGGAAAPPAGLEISFRPDPYLYDGRHANNGWLMELPRPITKLTWDNAALLAPATAGRLGVSDGDVVELRYLGRVLRAPVWVVPGHAPDAVTLPLGFGRRRGGAVANGVGVDAYALRTADAPWFGGGLEVARTGERYPLATTQDHQTMAGRPLVRTASLEEYRENPAFARELGEDPPKALSLYPPVDYPGYAWGMAIDLSTCIGCNACTLACQAENNIPVVGKEQVARGREMHWIRVDRYFAGDLDAPELLHQPVPCMHCENAPCEVVCPVNATVHDGEGLNVMVYNRCVGTRYCSNNCPYKVRRFNYFLYQDWTTPTYEMLRNPQVTVRSRGVMEKCTYCVQRINRARISAEEAGRRIADGDVVTACQQACPADAIVFGDVNDPASRVARLKADPRSYALLAELNTRPRTTYLAGIRNPNPELEQG